MQLERYSEPSPFTFKVLRQFADKAVQQTPIRLGVGKRFKNPFDLIGFTIAIAAGQVDSDQPIGPGDAAYRA